MIKNSYCLIHLLVAFALVSCSSMPPPRSAENGSNTSTVFAQGDRNDRRATTKPYSGDAADQASQANRDDKIVLGSGVFVQGAGKGQANGYASADGITLNFEQASLPEFLRVVFETILGENYLIDPQVKGTVTLHTTRAVKQETVLPIVEAVLEQNGAALVRDEGMFKVVPLGGSRRCLRVARSRALSVKPFDRLRYPGCATGTCVCR